jgi:hypothetical protein
MRLGHLAHHAFESPKGTHAHELQFAFRHFGYEMTLLADLRGNAQPWRPGTARARIRRRHEL